MPKKEVLDPSETKKKVEATIDELVTIAECHAKLVKAATKTSGKAQARAMRAAVETRAALLEAVDADRAAFTSFTTACTSPDLFAASEPARGAKVTPIQDESKH